MVEVVKSNFEENLPKIEDCIKKANFIAIDTEFSALNANDKLKSSLFDGPHERYEKQRTTCMQCTITQIGLTAFVKKKDENIYVAHSFNFYLFPNSKSPFDVRFLVQASSFAFLAEYNFDFNKFVYEGIPYMNQSQRQVLEQNMKDQEKFKSLTSDLDEDKVAEMCTVVAEWLVDSSEGQTLNLSDLYDYKINHKGVFRHCLVDELNNRFASLWARYDKETKEIVLEKIKEEDKQKKKIDFMKDTMQNETNIKDSLLGFTRVMDILIEAKKPIVGHNMILDLMLIFQSFYKPLPEKLSHFKQDLMTIFPTIFDTKHISSSCRKALEESGLSFKTTLSILYEAVQSESGISHTLCSPGIIHAEESKAYDGVQIPHEAAFDAYMCGCVFLRLAHILQYKDLCSTQVMPSTFSRYLQTMEPYKNRANVIRGSLNHLNLDSADGDSHKPSLLLVRSRSWSYHLERKQLAQWFSTYGAVDIRMESPLRALVATGNYGCYKDILYKFKKKNISVCKYSYWRHSNVARGIKITGVVVSGGLFLLAYLAYRKGDDHV